MATRVQQELRDRHVCHGALRLAARLPLFALLLTAGCVSLGSFTGSGDAPPTGAVYQVAALWNSQIAFAADPTHGGASMPGLAGRVYLFGPEIGTPLRGEGGMVVDLFDETTIGQSVMLEEWRLDKDSLEKLLRKDMVGWGYTLFLPWGTYKQEIKRVRLKLRYEPAKGAPLYAESAPLTLNAVQDFQTSNKSVPVSQTSSAACGLVPQGKR